MGRYTSYLMDVQNEGGGWSRPLLDNVHKKEALFLVFPMYVHGALKTGMCARLEMVLWYRYYHQHYKKHYGRRQRIMRSRGAFEIHRGKAEVNFKGSSGRL